MKWQLELFVAVVIVAVQFYYWRAVLGLALVLTYPVWYKHFG